MWLLPSYNRPELLKQTLAHCVATGMTTPGVILVNGGDQKAYRNIPLPPNWRIKFRPENLGWAQGCAALMRLFPDEPWYGFFYDDMVPVTPGWDVKLLERLKPNGIVTAENNFHNPPRIQTAVLDGNLVRKVGFITLPGTWSCFTDDFWERLGEDLGTWSHAKDVIVETLNPRNGKMSWQDEAHVAGYGPNNERLEADRLIWDRFISDGSYGRMLDGFRVRPKIPKGSKLFIATPVADGWFCSAYITSLMGTVRLLNQFGIEYQYYLLQKCSVLHHARNRLVGKFLASNCTHMLFIDADMGWEHEAPLELMAHNKDVIGAIGVTKEDDPVFCVKHDPSTFKWDALSGLMRVTGVGAAFLMLKREAVEKVAKRYEHMAYKDVKADEPVIPNVFWTDVVDGQMIGEDYTFCDRWRATGGEVWVDPGMPLEHVGQKSYTGTYAKHLKEQIRNERSERSQAA
jgi:hypothetical protein